MSRWPTRSSARGLLAGHDLIIDRAHILSDLVASLMSENKPNRNYEIIMDMVGETGRAGPEVGLGDLIAAQTGVCRHRSIFFKVLADILDVPRAPVRGNYTRCGADQDGAGRQGRGAHAWNEVVTATGVRLFVDVMHNVIIDLGDPYVSDYTDRGEISIAAPPMGRARAW